MPEGEAVPGLETFLTSDVMLDVLDIPNGGLLRISAALLFLGDDDLFAFYWRDAQSKRPHCKLVSADGVRACFQEMPSSLSFDSGWLPQGTLRFGLDAGGTRWVSMVLPASRRRLSILDTDLGLQEVELPLPGLVFTGRGRSYWIWAVKDEVVTPQTQVFHAPLSNVDEVGRICFGANALPEADGTSMMHALHLFLDSPFNGHHASQKSRTHQGDIRFLLQDVASQKRDHFPDDELLPIIARDCPVVTLDLLLKYVLGKER